jgi:hypothetical protein
MTFGSYSLCLFNFLNWICLPWQFVFRQDRTTKGVAIYCRESLQSSVILSRSVPKQFELLLLKIHLSRNKSLTVSACYRPLSAPSCALDTICKLIAPHLSSEFILLGRRNWDMLNTPAVLHSKLDALNLTQIIKESTSYNPKSINMGTLIDIILTNLSSKYTSASLISAITASLPASVMGPRSNDHPSSLSYAP